MSDASPSVDQQDSQWSDVVLHSDASLSSIYPFIGSQQSMNGLLDLNTSQQSSLFASSEDVLEPQAKKNLITTFDFVGNPSASSLPPRPPKSVVSLPTTTSKNFSSSLSVTSVRKSPRLNKFDGFQHSQYTPKKKRRGALLVPAAAPSENVAPIASIPELKGQDPGPIPMEVLQAWGVECGVPPEVISKDALSKLGADDH